MTWVQLFRLGAARRIRVSTPDSQVVLLLAWVPPKSPKPRLWTGLPCGRNTLTRTNDIWGEKKRAKASDKPFSHFWHLVTSELRNECLLHTQWSGVLYSHLPRTSRQRTSTPTPIQVNKHEIVHKKTAARHRHQYLCASEKSPTLPWDHFVFYFHLLLTSPLLFCINSRASSVKTWFLPLDSTCGRSQKATWQSR